MNSFSVLVNESCNKVRLPFNEFLAEIILYATVKLCVKKIGRSRKI